MSPGAGIGLHRSCVALISIASQGLTYCMLVSFGLVFRPRDQRGKRYASATGSRKLEDEWFF